MDYNLRIRSVSSTMIKCTVRHEHKSVLAHNNKFGVYTMSELLACPNCNYHNPAQSQDCERCGINLAIAAVLAENIMDKSLIETQELPVAPELLVPRLGDYLIDKGLVTPDDLSQALGYQEKQKRMGKPVLLGQALVALEMIDTNTLDQTITEQIVELQEALRKSNQTLDQRVIERTSELQNALKQLTDLNTLKTNFVSNISHELRTPLAHMVGYLELLHDEELGTLNEAQHKAVNVMLKAYGRLYSLIDNLIQFSLVAEDKLSINTSKVPVIRLIETTITHAQATAIDKQIKLNYTLPSATLQVQADEQRITWALAQLVDNAIKFNTVGGEVSLTAAEENGLVNVYVRDTGIGIPEEQIKELYQPFHQLDSSATRHYGGTGIGLALVQQILEAHGARLNVRSTPGKGSVFSFTLPAL